MFDPPVLTPISRIMRKEEERRVWYCRSERVWAGATVMESPVCTPMGSRFSMEQMTTTLSSRSRITSSSNSFQPATLFSTRTEPTGLASRPSETARRSSAWSLAGAPPLPPNVKLDGEVQGGLPAQGWEERVGALLAQDLGDGLDRERLPVGGVGNLGVGHDRSRVRVDEDYAVSLVA